MNRDVFVWLLAVALIGRNIWLADRHSITEGQREYLWSRPLVAAWWAAQRERWAEEEARQDAARSLREYGPPDETLALAPPGAPHQHPDVSHEEEPVLLAWGRLDRPGFGVQRRGLKKITAIRLGPRPEDYFEAAAADSPGDVPFSYASGTIW